MRSVDGPADDSDDLRAPEPPVIIDEWAEASIDLARWQSRRRHPSNQQPSWEEDGGYVVEWVI
jgi:hypothetical protein